MSVVVIYSASHHLPVVEAAGVDGEVDADLHPFCIGND